LFEPAKAAIMRNSLHHLMTTVILCPNLVWKVTLILCPVPFDTISSQSYTVCEIGKYFWGCH